MKKKCIEFIRNLPKAELHVHLEGTLEPQKFLAIAERNNIDVPYGSIEQLKSVLYTFHDLASFIDVYRRVIAILKTEQDFYEVAYSYLQTVASKGVLHAEIFFDVQSYTHHKISSQTIMHGLSRALNDAQKHYNISASMILCFIRDMSEDDALETLEIMKSYKDIVAIGLASVEHGNQPSKFFTAFAKAREYGYHIVAHAGEECGPEYIWQSLLLLKAERIDHGIACMQDPKLIDYLVDHRIPLTVCPLSNIALNRFKSIKEHPLKKMYDAGLMVTINSDDPAFFNGYIDDNFIAVKENLSFSCKELTECARNSILASFMHDTMKREYLKKLEDYIKGHSCKG